MRRKMETIADRKQHRLKQKHELVGIRGAGNSDHAEDDEQVDDAVPDGHLRGQ